MGGIYQFPTSKSAESVVALSTYLPALKKCLEQHPFLSAVVLKPESDEVVYDFPDTIDLTYHFLVHERSEAASHEDIAIGKKIEYLSNSTGLTFFDSIAERPGWRLDILPLDGRNGRQRAWIGFTYCHCIGDGRSGIIFQESFFAALIDTFRTSAEDDDHTYKPKQTDLLELPKLSVSVKYLLGPALGHYLPEFLSKWLGLKASTSGSDDGTWTGPLTFLNNSQAVPKAVTAVAVYTIDRALLVKVLQACRAHNAKLTSLLNVLIAQSLSRNLPRFADVVSDKDNFVAEIPTNLRRVANIPEKTIGNFSSVAYSRHAIDRSLTVECEAVVTSDMWSAASQNSKDLSKLTSELIDQPIGLLSWISDLDSWMKDQIGKPRDSSWQLSNLMTFEGRAEQSIDDPMVIEKMFFCQPAAAAGSPLDFNTVSLAGGDLVICVGWQIGAIGLATKLELNTENTEREFVSRLLTDLTAYLESAAQ